MYCRVDGGHHVPREPAKSGKFSLPLYDIQELLTDVTHSTSGNEEHK
jgi:hypothetical protein